MRPCASFDAQAINAIAATPEILNNFDRLTIVDGAVLPDEVNTIFANGNQADVPVLIGSNADEATTFDPALSTSEVVDYRALRTAQGNNHNRPAHGREGYV